MALEEHKEHEHVKDLEVLELETPIASKTSELDRKLPKSRYFRSFVEN